MNNKFDALARNMAQSVTRRGAVKQFGLGLAGIALAAMSLRDKALADPQPNPCTSDSDCPDHKVCSSGVCVPSVKYHCRCGDSNYGCDPSSPTFYDCVFYCGGSSDKHACGGGG